MKHSLNKDFLLEDDKNKKKKIMRKYKKHFRSKVWKYIDNKNFIFNKFGYLVVTGSKGKKIIVEDSKKIKEFIDEFIPDDDSFAKKFKKELLRRWMALYVQYIDIKF